CWPWRRSGARAGFPGSDGRSRGPRPALTGVAVLVSWIAPGILEALIPGRMQGHGGTAEVSGGAARARGEDGVRDPGAGREGAWGAGPGRAAAGCSPRGFAVLGQAGGN